MAVAFIIGIYRGNESKAAAFEGAWLATSIATNTSYTTSNY